MARLVGESGVVVGKEWPIEVGVTLGRDAHNTVGMPENRKASRDHAKVWREGPGKYSVVDLGSTNGTLVNDERITRHALVDGDELRVGEATFRFVLDDDEKPRRKEARVADVLRGTAAPAQQAFGAPGSEATTAAAAPAAPKIEVKQRVLQYHKKDAAGSAVGWDLSQASSGVRWAFILGALAVAAVVFFVVKGMVAG
jgi:hypothetical protein